MTDKPYHVKYWGSAESIIKAALGTEEQDFWFATDIERLLFIDMLQRLACGHQLIYVCHEGEDVDKETSATVILELPTGQSRRYIMNFGYGYPEGIAEYMWTEGNYACDCNRSLFLGLVPEWNCGDAIKLKSIKVEKVTPA